ncbi:MAG: hypothetical protein JWN51_766 [Phycisphaerales bacterium]|nr:hypothetical protein [Phycisphaerales bacterium]
MSSILLSGDVDVVIPSWVAPVFAACVLFVAVVIAMRVHYLRQRKAPLRRVVAGLCPICGYDLTGNVSGTCPECGGR